MIADLTKQYISSYTGRVQASVFPRVLPRWIDDLTRLERDDIYEQMLLDAQVKSCVGVLVDSILGGGIEILSSDSTSSTANRIADFCRSNLDDMDTPFLSEVLPDMLDVIMLGNRIAEKVFYQVPGGKLAIRKIVPRHRTSVSYYVDEYMNVKGIVPIEPGIGIKQTPTRIIPTEKFFILRWGPKNGDPRGTSDGRAVYDPWWFKQQLKPEYLKYLSQFASPSLVGKTAEIAQRRPQYNMVTGEIDTNADGTPVLIDPAEQMSSELEKFRNGFYIVLPYGADVEPIQMSGDGGAFIAALNIYNTEIAKGILYQTAATENPNSGKNVASVHQDVLTTRVEYGKTLLESAIRTLLKHLVRINWGENAPIPIVIVPGTEQQDVLAKASAVSKLHDGGAILPSQWKAIYAELGLPAPNEDEIELLRKAFDSKFIPPVGMIQSGQGEV